MYHNYKLSVSFVFLGVYGALLAVPDVLGDDCVAVEERLRRHQARQRDLEVSAEMVAVLEPKQPERVPILNITLERYMS